MRKDYEDDAKHHLHAHYECMRCRVEHKQVNHAWRDCKCLGVPCSEECRAKEEPEKRAREEAEKHLELLRKEPRTALSEWMDCLDFANLQKWLAQARNQLEPLFESGDIPVVGWSRLAEKLRSKEEWGRKLDAELDANAREHEQIQQQIRVLQEKQEKLANRNKKIREEIKKIDEIAVLQSESESISLLSKKEETFLAKTEEKMKNPYFIGELDFSDVSTIFSMFEMDAIFYRFKNKTDGNLKTILPVPVADLQKNLELEFSEAVDFHWKLRLLENGVKGVANHLSKCHICPSAKPGVLLKEYGLGEQERKQIEEKIKGWKGYYLLVNGPSAFNLPEGAGLVSSLGSCLAKIQEGHKWD